MVARGGYHKSVRNVYQRFLVFLAPILGFWSTAGAVRSFGLVLILTVGHAVSLAAHYELFKLGKRSNSYFPLQEKFAVGATIAVAFTYLTALSQ